jgi:hypothetical protein
MPDQFPVTGGVLFWGRHDVEGIVEMFQKGIDNMDGMYVGDV